MERLAADIERLVLLLIQLRIRLCHFGYVVAVGLLGLVRGRGIQQGRELLLFVGGETAHEGFRGIFGELSGNLAFPPLLLLPQPTIPSDAMKFEFLMLYVGGGKSYEG